MTETITRRDALDFAIDTIEEACIWHMYSQDSTREYIKVLQHMIDQLDKQAETAKEKRTASRATTANEKEVRALHKRLVELDSIGAIDTQYVMEHTHALTPQKATAIMTLGIKLGLFEKTYDKKKALYWAIR